MTNAHDALRAYLIAASPLRTYLDGDLVYWPEVPGGGDPPMPDKAISFRGNGGFSEPELGLQRASVSFKVWGSTAHQAMEVYLLMRDRLHGAQSVVQGGVGFYNIVEEVPGQPLEDPVTNWPYIFAVYTCAVATVAIPSAP